MVRTRNEGRCSEVASDATKGTSSQQPGGLRYEMVTGTRRGTGSQPFPATVWREELRVKRERPCRGI